MLRTSEMTPNLWSQIQTPLRQFGERVAEFFSPSSEAATTKEAYEISVELPGVAEKDIAVDLHGDQLTVTGEKRAEREETGKDYYFSERSFGKFRRAFRLPADADAAGISATHKNGVLTIAIPKIQEPANQAKRIEVKRA